jgi:hypothetical protein
LSPATSRPEAASTSVPLSGTDWSSTTSAWACCSSPHAGRVATVGRPGAGGCGHVDRSHPDPSGLISWMR